jgi:hypothetical protein
VKNLRFHERTYPNIKYHPDFEIVRKGEENMFIVIIGGRSGTVLTDPDDYNHFVEGHLYIRAESDRVIQNFIDLQPELKDIANVTSRIRNCGLTKIVDAYTRRYGRPNSLDV